MSLSKALLTATSILAAIPLAGCKIVYDSEVDETQIPPGPEGDDARNQQRIDTTFDAELLPLIQDKALPVAELRSQVLANIDAAGAAHGNRGSGAGAAWNFPVSGDGTVVAAKLDTRARTLDVDTDADGIGDVTLQLGPVIRGTTLRDAAPFYDFDDFRDQIEFAKLSTALNARITAMIEIPEGDPTGQQVSFVGVTPLKSASDAIVVTPIQVQILP